MILLFSTYVWLKQYISILVKYFPDEVNEKWIKPTVYKEDLPRSGVLTLVFKAVEKCM